MRYQISIYTLKITEKKINGEILNNRTRKKYKNQNVIIYIIFNWKIITK